jgi:hypothetical protein
MPRTRLLVLAGAAAFALSLVATVPAATALALLGGDRLRASGAMGTLWSGSAAALEVGAVRLGETHWDVAVTRLLLGRLAADVETRIGDGEFRGALSTGLSGSLACAGCTYEGPIAGLRGLVPSLGRLDGRARLDLATLEVADGWPTRAIGTIKLTNVPITVPGAAPRPGAPSASFDATVEADPVPEGGLIEVAVQDAGGPLEFSARLAVTPPGNYELAGRAKPRPDAPQDMVNALAVLGPRDADGGTELSMSGSF